MLSGTSGVPKVILCLVEVLVGANNFGAQRYDVAEPVGERERRGGLLWEQAMCNVQGLRI